MLINAPRRQVLEMVNTWIYKRGGHASEYLRIIDTDQGFKVGVIDYVNLENELVTDQCNCSIEQARKIKHIIIGASN